MNTATASFPTTVWDGSSESRDVGDDRGPDDKDFDRVVREIQALQKPVSPGAAAGTGVTATEIAGQIYKTTITIAALSVTTVDAGAAGAHGSQKIYDFPEGNILVLGAVGELTLTAGAGGITDTASVVASVGTVAVGTDNATLTSTEADIVPSTAATLSGGIGTANMQNTATLIKDGTATPVDAILNIAVPDAGSSADDTVTVDGTLTITWMNLGNN